MKNQQPFIQRYDKRERLNHWLVALCFITLAISGMGFMFPSFFWLTGIFGTPQTARIVHPLVGVLMFVSFSAMFVRYFHHNILEKSDIAWLKAIDKVATNRELEGEAAQVGRYNAGQKILFWSLGVCMLVLFITGLIAWRPYFAPAFSVPIIRLALLLHAVAATVLICLIITHIYAAIWINGTIRAMVEGYVSSAWAKTHHPRWYNSLNIEDKTQNTVHEKGQPQ